MIVTKENQIIRVAPVPEEMIETISTSTADARFFQTMWEVMRILADEIELKSEESVAIVETPRGGSWSSAVVAMQERFAEADLTTANTSSKDRNKGLPILPDNFPLADHYIIPDGIMATGSTMVKIIKEIWSRCQDSDKNLCPRFTLLCPVVYEHKDETDNQLVTWIEELKKQGVEIEVQVIAGGMEAKGEYIKFFNDQPPMIALPKGPGSVLVVGEIDHKGQEVTGIKIGDFGDMYQEALEAGVLPGMFGLVNQQ